MKPSTSACGLRAMPTDSGPCPAPNADSVRPDGGGYPPLVESVADRLYEAGAVGSRTNARHYVTEFFDALTNDDLLNLLVERGVLRHRTGRVYEVIHPEQIDGSGSEDT